MNYEMELAIVVLVSLAIGAGAFIGARRVRGGPGVKKTLRIAGVALALLTAYVFQPLPEMPAWEEPATEQERKARDFAHAIVLPDSVPKPVPFNFALARLKALVPGLPYVSEQYFKHLCDTEAGQYIFRTAENVDGFLQMRPRRRYTDIEQMDPYLIESAIGLDASDADEFYSNERKVANGAPTYFIQPMAGRYSFFEQPINKTTDLIAHFYRDAKNPDPAIGPYEIQTAERGTGNPVIVPFLIARRVITSPESSHAYTWRGIRRVADRSHWISGGEVILIDRTSNVPIAVFRDFKYGARKYSRWDMSRSCIRGDAHYPHLFIPLVLQPRSSINDEFLLLKAK